MKKFLEIYNVEKPDDMYGKDVFLTIFPDESEGHFVYKGTLLGYGAYGSNPEHKTFCVYVDRGDTYRFVDYFQDGCFKSKEDYEAFRKQRKEKCDDGYTVDRLRKIADLEEEHIKVLVKAGDMVYPVNGVASVAKSIKEPAFVLKADVENGKKWQYE